MFRGRSLRSRKLRGRPDSGEENVTLDYSKAPAENIKEILNNVVDQSGTSKTRKLAYYNAFVRLCYRSGNEMDFGMSTEEVLCCLRLGFYHEAKEMRAACMRAIRYMCTDHETVDAIVRLHIDYLITRSLDYCLDNEIERIHALRLMRKMMLIHPEHFPKSLLNVLISIANDGAKERDKMLRTCLATLCELSLLNPKLVVKSGAFSAILRSILDSYHLPRINESLLATVLNLLNHPATRQNIKSDIELQQLLAPFTDCHYRFSGESVDQSLREERENRYAASKMAITTVIRAWPGIIRLCRPDGAGLQSLLGVLYLPNMETRKEIMDILYDVFRVAVPEWTDDFSQALVSVDPSEMRDSWKLSEGFVAEEGKSVLPHITRTRTDLVDNHLALILSSFISAGLLEALVESVATSEVEVSIRATILIGEILHMANSILPQECNQTSHCLPSLMSLAASFTISSQQRNLANMAITCLSRLHAMKKRGPVPCSLYLDQILQSSGLRNKEEMYRPLKLHRENLMQCLPKEAEHDVINQAVFDSQVLRTKENFSWNWDLIAAILKWPDENLKKIDDQSNQRFMRRLVYFFKPSSKLFSAVELSHENCKKFIIAGCHLVDFLVECDKGEGQKIWEDWLSDIKQCLNEVTAQRAPSDALFTPSYLSHTVSQDYFLFIGRFSASDRGDKIIEKTGIYQCLLDLMTITSHDTYIKLIVSSLDYSRDGLARVILSKGLTATSENARLYTASFMRVLLRARVPFLASWGMELLVMQLYDQSRAVAMEALSVISEACEEEVNLVNLVKLRPSVLHLGYKGSMLLARFLSVPTGFRSLLDSGYISHELEKWHQGFNAKYVSIVEERLNEAFTTYEKTYDGSYTRRSSRRQPRQDVYMPVHLYGQLVQHKAGYELLEKQEYLPEYFHCIRCQELKKEEQILKLKSALWAVGHMGTSVWGLGLLQEESIIPEIIKIAEESGVFTIRGTAFFVLGLVASTNKGADILSEFGWESVRHKHTDLWPVILENYTSDCTELTSNLSSVSLASSAKSDVPTAGSSLLMSQWSERKETGYHSPSDQSPSPKASFFIDDDVVKSRSNTESSLPPVGLTSPSESPQKDSGVNLEPVIDSKVDVEVHFSDSRGRSQSANSQQTRATEQESLSPHSRSQSDPQDRSGQFVIQELPEIQLQADSRAAGQLTNTSQRTSQTVTIRKPPWVNPEYKSKSLEKDLLKQRSSSYREDRSSSNTSSWTTKSRSDSVNTDTTTSGVSSVESAPHFTVEYTQVGSLLSPIPSASSVATDGRSQQGDNISIGVHPSDTLRKLMNFKRVPSLKRRYSNPVLGHVSPMKVEESRGGFIGDGVMGFSTQQDVQGYAALRELQLQRQRTFSVETEPGMDVSPELEEPFLHKAKSMDYRLGGPRNGFRPRPGMATLPSKFPFANMSFRKQIARVMACTRNQSFISLQELDRPASSANLQAYDSFPHNMSKQSLRRVEKVPSSGRAEYIGLCLPVDVNMVFQVNEGEDKRSCSDDIGISKDIQEVPERLPATRSVSQSDDDGLECHNPSTCLGCYRVRSNVTVSFYSLDVETADDEAFTPGSKPPSVGSTPFGSAQPTPSVSAGPSPNPPMDPPGRKGTRSRNSSMTEMMANLPGSVVSNASFLDSATRHLMSENSEEGRRLIRKECLRLIINLGSSVGVKAAEQGLLILRQKFATSFQDICLYSEVCYLLAHYNFRLSARRFIQELFQDITFSEHYKEPHEILGIPMEETLDRAEIPKELHEKLDRVEESIKMEDSIT